MKKNYIKPTQRIHKVQIRTYMQTISGGGKDSFNAGLDPSYTGNGDDAVAKEHDLWGNEW